MRAMKIRCLIVDDEAIIIQRLALFFDSISGAGSRFELAGSAYSGNEGLEAAVRLKPELVITDIKMPGIDGITMIERMKETMPDTEFIILTAFQDFNYAKRAIHMNVSDFIVKVPLNENDLLQAMNKAADRLVESHAKQERLFQLKMAIRNNRHRVFKQFFRELLRGEIKPGQAEEIISSYDMRLFQHYYCCMAIELNAYAGFVGKYSLTDQKIMKYGILNVIEETLQPFGQSFACEIEQNRFIAFLSRPYSPSQKDQEASSREAGQAVVRHVRTYMKQSVSIGISGLATGWASIVASYTQALEACAEHYYNGIETVITPSGRARQVEGSPQLARQHLQITLKLLQRNTGETGEIKGHLQMLQPLAARDKLSRVTMAGLLKEFMLAATHRISQWKLGQAEEAGDGALLSYMTLVEQIDYVADFVARQLQLQDSPGSPAIAKAVAYIEENLTERLTLQMVAKQANLAPAYLSSLFKKEMKESLIDYINRKKIEQAVELLKCRSYTNNELCEAVGILNEAYFCTLFKQKTGLTPGQFRKQL